MPDHIFSYNQAQFIFLLDLSINFVDIADDRILQNDWLRIKKCKEHSKCVFVKKWY